MAKKAEQAVTVDSVPLPPPRSLTDLVIDVGRQWAVLAGAIIGLGYVAGYLVINLYLGYLGIRAPSLIAPRYLATGVLYLVVTFLPYGPIIAALWLLKRENIPLRSWRSVGRIMLSILLALIVTLTLGSTLLEVKISDFFNGALSAGYWVVYVAYIINTALWVIPFALLPSSVKSRITGNTQTADDEFAWYIYPAFVLIAVSVPLASLFVFSRIIYPSSSAAYAGGGSVKVQIFIDSDALVSQSLPMSDQDGVTEPIDLVDQSDDGYIILLSDKTIVIVPKDQVRGVIIKP